MLNIKVDVNETIKDGYEVVFKSPCDCSEISGLAIYYPDTSGDTLKSVFNFKDAHGNILSDLDNLFTEGVYVKVILNVTEGIAYIQNADTNKYLENRFNHTVTQYISVNRKFGSVVGVGSSSVGIDCEASGKYSHAEGEVTIAKGKGSHVEGSGCQATGDYSHAEGKNTQALAYESHAEGLETKACAPATHAEGHLTEANYDGGHAEGWKSKVNAPYGHSEGVQTEVIGEAGHAEGKLTKAENSAHAEGWGSQALGTGSHAEGLETVAEELYSHTEGVGTIASSKYQHVQGKYNVKDGENKYADIIGGGTSETDRKNIYTLDWQGNAEFGGDVVSTDENGNKISLKQVKETISNPVYTVAKTLTELKSGEKLNVSFGKIAKAIESLILLSRVRPALITALGNKNLLDPNNKITLKENVLTRIPLEHYSDYCYGRDISGESYGFDILEDGGIKCPVNGWVSVSGSVYYNRSANTERTKRCSVKHYHSSDPTPQESEVCSQSVRDLGTSGGFPTGSKIIHVKEGDIIYLYAFSSVETTCVINNESTYLSLVYVSIE